MSLWSKVKDLVDARIELRANRALLRSQEEKLQQAEQVIASWEKWSDTLNREERKGLPADLKGAKQC
ncbi:MAG: hypothetical protein ACRD3P_00760 [Terriglobales bacterium]